MDSSPANSEISSRRQSQLAARFRSKRAESVKNDHVFFADEFQDQDVKFTPHLDYPETEFQPEVKLFRNERFMLDEIFQRNANNLPYFWNTKTRVVFFCNF